MENHKPVDIEASTSLMLERESTWFHLAVVFGFIVLVLVTFGAIDAMISIKDAASYSQRIEVIYKHALIGGAVVTFCTVVWRGLVSIRQATAQVEATKNQTEQIRLTREQMQATERNELAKLFQKGTELIGSISRSEISAGISTLEVVALERRMFSIQSLDIMFERYEHHVNDNHRSVVTSQLKDSIEQIIDQTGFKSNRHIKIRMTEKGRIQLINGAKGIDYTAGHLYTTKRAAILIKSNDYTFNNTRVSRGYHEVVGGVYQFCRFEHAYVSRWDCDPDDKNTFSNCDFSGCVMINDSLAPIEGEGNTYDSENPPVDAYGMPIVADWIKENLSENAVISE